MIKASLIRSIDSATDEIKDVHINELKESISHHDAETVGFKEDLSDLSPCRFDTLHAIASHFNKVLY